MNSLPPAFDVLAQYNQFIIWTSLERDGKIVKLPVDHKTLKIGNAHDPNIQTDVNTAIISANLFGDSYGVGFVFSSTDPFYFVDIDHCLQPDNTWSPIANTLMGMLPGAAVEISQSGTGLHIIGRGVTPEHSCKNISLGIELYTQDRFVALTGNNVVGSANVDNSATLPMLVNQYFPPKVLLTKASWTTEPVAEWNGLEDDEELIKKACKSGSAANKFGTRASFNDLWTRNVSSLADAYPSDVNDPGEYDESSADAGLAQHLAFWTGKNCDRILSLMLRSGLVRDKWKREQYMHDTVLKAVSMQKDVYSKVKPSVSTTMATNEPVVLDCYQFMGIDQQLEHFKGCVYIQDVHKIFTPSGSLLKPEQFNAMYGGYVFQLETNASGKDTRKAWEAFVESRAIRYPKAHSGCFRPDLDSGVLVNHEGRTLINTYVPVETPSMSGDITPFLNHLNKLLPDQRDKDILLAYMAACIQHKGYKFQWCPMIQGAPGNGKTLFTRCLEFALGERYSHMPPASEVGEKHNDWLFGKLLIGIEDAYFPNHKQEIIEILKPMITNDRLSKRAMQHSQEMDSLCANFIMNANRKDAVFKDRNDRRLCIFFTKQQSAEDIACDGMGGDYFPNLYHWLRNGGYAIINHYLGGYAIPDELNPATHCHRAPITSTTEEAILGSVGAIEQEILEAIDEGQQGFNGGWVSSMALTRLLETHRKAHAITRAKRKEILESLGYIYHPGLKEGRVNNAIIIDGGKPRLFIKKGHIHSNLTSAKEIVRTYVEAQTTGPTNDTSQKGFNHG